MQRKTLTLLIAALLLVLPACVVIEDGEVGVMKSFGKISDEPVSQGVTFVLPVARQLETWNIKLQERKESTTVPSSEGMIVKLETSLLFQVLPNQAPTLRKTVGRNYVEKVVVPYFRSALRDVVSGYQVRQIYSTKGRLEIATRMRDQLAEDLEPRGIKIVDVLLRDIQLPQRFRESIEAKLTAEQRVQEKQFELEQAKKEAEIEVARAKGAAEAQTIINSTLSNSYLHYLWIQTLNENPNVVYVATEANMPIFKPVATGGN
ncbi:MAG: prohibitin family protein [Deltaproteobacteria bacterium]|nr:prohibitin family protein [Deltaproteobacteria bacterium]MBW2396261.1 prohibitin family protein [Deltaproteobacteria bacterium]